MGSSPQKSNAFMPGASMHHSPPITLPLRYMVLGLINFFLFALDLAYEGARGALLTPGAASTVALTHLLTLGALMSFVMGAVYQLSTVAFLIPIVSVRLADFNFYGFLIALGGLVTSFAVWWTAGLLLFGSLMAVTLYIFSANMIVSLMKSTVRGPMWRFVLAAHIHLALALSVAILLVFADANVWPHLNLFFGPLLASHILLAAGGFFGFLIFGYSYKLLPMFTLSHGFRTDHQSRAFEASLAGLWALILWAWFPNRVIAWIACVLCIAAVAFHAGALHDIFKKRLRRRIEIPIRGVLVGTGMSLIWVVLLGVQTVVLHAPAAWRGLVPFELVGFVAITVMSLAYKIIPFLVWTWRYSRTQRENKKVLIADLISSKSALPVIVATGIGVMGLSVGA